MSEVHVDEIEGRITLADERLLLSPQILERLVRLLEERLKAQELAAGRRARDASIGGADADPRSGWR